MMNSGAPEAMFGAVFLGIFCVAILIGVGIQCFICWLLADALKKLPPEYRQQQPGMVWLLLIPLFNIVWNFFVYPKISDSYQAYFAARTSGQAPTAPNANLNYAPASANVDTARGIGLAYCICVPLSIIPYAGACAGLASLVLLIIYLVKISGLKSQVAN